MIYQTIDTEGQFADAFIRAGRANQFSPSALNVLFNMLNDSDIDTELDVIAICCEYSEYTVKDLCEEYEEAEDVYNEAMEIGEDGEDFAYEEVIDWAIQHGATSCGETVIVPVSGLDV